MKTLLGILGLSLDGFSLVSKLKAFATWAALSAVVAGVGYVAGRVDGASICIARAANANAIVRDADLDKSFSDDDFNRATIATGAAAENSNEAIDAKLSAAEPHDGNLCLSADWMRVLDAVK